jgi:peptidoglycan biosynthesis/recognition FemAB-like protein
VGWSARPAAHWLAPLVSHLEDRRVVSIRIGPAIGWRRWTAGTVKAAAEPGLRRRLGDIPPDDVDEVADELIRELRALGWVNGAYGAAFPGWSRFTFEVPLAGTTPETALSAMNQQWRRGIRKAEKAGVTVVDGSYGDLADFHRVYVATANRDGFTARPLDYFQRVYTALNADAPGRVRLYLGCHEGQVLAGMLVVTIVSRASYVFGGSADEKREVYPNHAVHWRIIRDCIDSGVDVYGMRGIDDCIDPDDHEFGVLRFKLGTGGCAVERVGDWDYFPSPVLQRAVAAAVLLHGTARRLRRRPASRHRAGSAVMALGEGSARTGSWVEGRTTMVPTRPAMTSATSAS